MNPEITWQRVEAANAQALQRMLAVQPAWVGVLRLSELIPDLDPMTLTHACPPVTWSRMSGAQRGGVIAAVLYEGWAKDPQTAAQLAEDGQVSLVPNHDLGGVGPMAGRSVALDARVRRSGPGLRSPRLQLDRVRLLVRMLGRAGHDGTPAVE